MFTYNFHVIGHELFVAKASVEDAESRKPHTKRSAVWGMEALLSFMRLEETRPCQLVAYLRHACVLVYITITTLRLQLSVVLPR